eukprot:5522099-Prymnesium_polylepis.1
MHGGAPLPAVQLELSDSEMRDSLFDGRREIDWHRIADHQVVSLRQIAEQLLSHTPKYLGRSVSLVVPGSLLQQKIVISVPV